MIDVKFIIRLKMAGVLHKTYRFFFKLHQIVNPVGFSSLSYKGEPLIADDNSPLTVEESFILNEKFMGTIKTYIPAVVPKNHEWSHRITELRELAEKHQWREIDWQDKTTMISFLRDGVRMNIYYTKMTVGTAMYHPKKRSTQLFRKRCTMRDVEKLMLNPRQHTGKGYYKKGEL